MYLLYKVESIMQIYLLDQIATDVLYTLFDLKIICNKEPFSDF